MRLSKRATSLEPSITLTLFARAKALAAAGHDIVNMAVGEPDFSAPQLVQLAAINKIASGDVRYTPAAGTPSLRDAIAETLGKTRGGTWSRDEVTVCHSAKHALSGTLMVLVEEGDEVIVPLPAWSSYFALVRLAGGSPISVQPGPDCRPSLEAVEAAVSERTRVLMLSTPCNPSGYVWSAEEVKALTDLAIKHDFVILCDEIYRTLVYGGEAACSPASVSAAARSHTVIVDGASKAFAMTGYRIGFLAAPKHVATAVANLHGQMTGSPNAISQDALESGLRDTPPELEVMRAKFAARRRTLLAGLEKLGLRTPIPMGAFYAFPDVSDYLDERGSDGFCEDLLEQLGLALVPGSAFGLDNHVRLSYAMDESVVLDALDRLGRHLESRRSLALG
ncbi:MAG: aspartate/methionine/tyrosine aminotransferase [Gammaproteobacteria bacterium]|jgi:aspartate/methionine/tyrosine aminotransferase